MQRLLIGDVGATSSDWALIDRGERTFYQASGYNPTAQSHQRLSALTKEVAAQIPSGSDLVVKYYGAGFGFMGATVEIQEAFQAVLRCESIEVASDLLGAARALCQEESGLVAILGTGSNICHYDGRFIDHQGVTLGFPLGDEGSGSDIGGRLVRAFYYGDMPSEVAQAMARHLPRERYEFLSLFKASTAPNRLLASYVESIADLKNHPFVSTLIKSAFQDFTHRHLSKYETYDKISFAGSIAFYFCDELETVVNKASFKLARVLRKPIEALTTYH
ncbi:MAG: hypothetical protein OEQ53_20340, partial [Saprospiraceae bacterium]|nr:hypothetical protein [Saprospiraceae bacterium]